MLRILVIALAATIMLGIPGEAMTQKVNAPTTVRPGSDRQLRGDLERLAKDYERDPHIVRATFGVQVGDQVWTVDSSPRTAHYPARVTVTPGEPSNTFVFVTDAATFGKIMRGEISALTGNAAATSNDVVPFGTRRVGDYLRNIEHRHRLYSLYAHFWRMGRPEIIDFGFDQARTVHGGQATLIHYEPKFRSGWYGILPGQHINPDPQDQTNTFPSLFIFTRGGTGRAKIGGAEFPIKDHQAVMVPPGVAHEFWNPGKEPAEFILIMWGDDA